MMVNGHELLVDVPWFLTIEEYKKWFTKLEEWDKKVTEEMNEKK